MKIRDIADSKCEKILSESLKFAFIEILKKWNTKQHESIEVLQLQNFYLKCFPKQKHSKRISSNFKYHDLVCTVR